MNLLEALEQRTINEIGKFHLEIKNKNGKLVFNLDGFFTQRGESIYAHYKELRLMAGSQTENKKEARIKAIMRLIRLLAIRVLRDEEIQDEKLINFKQFIIENQMFEIDNDEENIPVYSEIFEPTDNGYRYYLKKHPETVKDLADLQKHKIERLEETDVNSFVGEVTEKTPSLSDEDAQRDYVVNLKKAS